MLLVASPLLDLKEVSRSNTPAPKRSSSLTKSQSGLLKRASTVGLNSPSECNDENKKLSTGIRKLSPGNIANMLREKRSQVVTTKLDNVDKENKPGTTDSPRSSLPAVSTPGRLRLQMKSGNGRLRKRASDTAVRPNQKHHVNPKNVSTPLQHKANGYDESRDGSRQTITVGEANSTFIIERTRAASGFGQHVSWGEGTRLCKQQA